MIPVAEGSAEALNEQEVLGVRAIAAAHLGHEPTRAQITAARRAAHGRVAGRLGPPRGCSVRLGGAARQVNHLVPARLGNTALGNITEYWRRRPGKRRSSRPAGRWNSASQLWERRRETSTSINSRPSRLAILLPFFRPRLPTSPGWDGVWSDALSAAKPLQAQP